MKLQTMKRILALSLTTVLAVSAIGCGTTETSTTGTTESAGEAVVEEIVQTEPVTYWTELNGNVAANYSNLGETNFGIQLQEQTGIEVEFTHPAVGQTAEAFSLLLSNKELPDVIEYSWLTYSGGPEQAISDGVIIPLNDVIEQYCPNLKAYLEANPEIDKMIKTDEGVYYAFPFIRGGDELRTSTGLVIRQDWLDAVNMEVPTTIDDWYEVLTAFKNELGSDAPFTYLYASAYLTNHNPFAYAFEAPRDYYVDGTEVKYGAVQDGYKEYLQTMNLWMEEGLIDVDLATLTGDQVTAKITNGTSGASFGYAGSGLGVWLTTGQGTDSEYQLVGAPYPTLEEGAYPEFGQMDNNYIGTGSAAISTTCDNVALVATLLDFAYGEEGHNLYNFGEEGVSYSVEDGENIFFDEVLNDPEMSTAYSLSNYIRATYNGPFIQDVDYAKQFYQLEEQVDALSTWSSTNASEHILPPITPSAEESSDFSQIMTEINTYRDEMSLKFILGTKSFDEWDDYVETIYAMGLQDAIDIENAALDRYNQR